MEDKQAIEQLLNINRQLTAFEKLERREQLIAYLNHLLLHDFNKLVQVLYKVDVSESKLKELLVKDADTNAAEIIADLLIERQEEKIKTKTAFKSNSDIADEDKW